MKIRRVGFYRELGHGDPDGPSLVDTEILPTPIKESLLKYLESAPILAASQLIVEDYFTGESIGRLNVLTDGKWAWPSDLAHYLRTHDSTLNPEFVQSVSRLQPATLSETELAQAVEDFLG